MFDQQRGHPGLIHSQANAIAGHTRLRNLKKRAADSIAIANIDFVIGQSLDCKILPKLPECEIVAMEMRRPMSVRIELINHHSAIHTAVSSEVTLSVAIDV